MHLRVQVLPAVRVDLGGGGLPRVVPLVDLLADHEHAVINLAHCWLLTISQPQQLDDRCHDAQHLHQLLPEAGLVEDELLDNVLAVGGRIGLIISLAIGLGLVLAPVLLRIFRRHHDLLQGGLQT